MKNKLIDEMVFDTKNDRWIFISDLKSGELIYKNKPVKVFQSTTGYVFFQTTWRYLSKSIQINNVSWEKCKETIKDRQNNAQHYAYMDHLNQQSTAEWYNDNSFNYKGD